MVTLSWKCVLRTLTAAIAVAFLVGCSGGGSGGEDGDGGALKLQGRAVMPAPVIGALVQVYRLDGEAPALVGLAETDSNGSFELSLPGVTEGMPLQVRVGGPLAQYEDLCTSDNHFFVGDQHLAAGLVASQGMGDELVIVDPFSTLAFAIAGAYRARGAALGISNTAWTEVIPLAAERVASHLAPDGAPDLRFTDPLLPDKALLPWPSGRSALGLALGALSCMAASIHDGKKAVTAADLVAGLGEDAEDGWLDGFTPSPDDGNAQAVVVRGAALSANTLRYDLAAALHEVVTEHGVQFKERADPVAELGRAGGLYEHLSLDDGPLFGDAAGKLFDPLPPVIELGPEGPEEDFLVTSTALFDLAATATDDHELASLQVTEPAALAGLAAEVAAGQKSATLSFSIDPASVDLPVVAYRFEAVDASGNSHAVERRLRFSALPPVLEEIVPGPGHCTATPAAELLVFAQHPQGAALTVTLLADGELSDCSLEEDGYHHCPGGHPDGTEVEVRVVDEGAHEVTEHWVVCVDDAPPEVAFSPPSGSWYGPADPVVEVTVEDAHGWALIALTLNDEGVVPLPEESPFEVLLPTEDGVEVALLGVVVEDDAGLSTAATAELLFDGEGPQFPGSSAIVTASFADVHHCFEVMDEGSGIAEVTLGDAWGEWTLEAADVGEWCLDGSTTEVNPGMPPNVSVTATDQVGNAKTQVFTVYLDETPPAVKQATTFVVDDRFYKPTYDAEAEVVVYDGDGAPKVSLNPTTCAATCPTFGTFVSRLAVESLDEVEALGTPLFKIQVDDACPAGAVAPTLLAHPRWYAGEELVYEGTEVAMSCGGSSASLPLVLPFADVGSAALEAVGDIDRLQVEVVDLAGHATLLDIHFDMQVLPPPLFIFPETETLPEDTLDLLLDGSNPALDVTVSMGGVHVRHRLVNPTPVSAEVTVGTLPQESLLINHSRVYGALLPAAGGACTIGQCRYQVEGGPAASCEPAKTFFADTWYSKTDLVSRLRRVDENGDWSILLKSQVIELGPSEWVYVDVLTAMVGMTPFPIEPAVEVVLGDGETVLAHLAHPDLWEAACTWEAGFPPTVTTYSVPDLITGASYKLKEGALLIFSVGASPGSAPA